MSSVIADTSTLQHLHRARHLDLLARLFGTVLVPEAVREELARGCDLGFDVPDPAACTWMEVWPVVRSPAVRGFELHDGERAVLSLALAVADPTVILDDAAARSATAALGIQMIGTLGVLLLAKERSLVTAVAPIRTP